MERLRLRSTRMRLNFVPEWEGLVEKTARKMAVFHEWRTKPLFDREDLVQEARIIFYRLVDRYPEVRTQAHFMRLFSRSFSNKINNLAKNTSRKRALVVGSFSHDSLEGMAGSLPSVGILEADVRLLLEDLAGDAVLDRVIRQLVTTDTPMRRLVRGSNRVTRETRGEFLCRVAQVPTSTDIIPYLQSLLQGEPNAPLSCS